MLNFTNISIKPAIKNKNKLTTNKLENAKQKLIKKNYDEIYEHEAAHKAAAGSLGGSIHIVNNSAGIPVSGFVPITIPAIPEKPTQNGLKKTIDHAKTVIKAAMAPKDPSAADYQVKAKAERTLSKAKSVKKKISQNIDFMA